MGERVEGSGQWTEVEDGALESFEPGDDFPWDDRDLSAESRDVLEAAVVENCGEKVSVQEKSTAEHDCDSSSDSSSSSSSDSAEEVFAALQREDKSRSGARASTLGFAVHAMLQTLHKIKVEDSSYSACGRKLHAGYSLFSEEPSVMCHRCKVCFGTTPTVTIP